MTWAGLKRALKCTYNGVQLNRTLQMLSLIHICIRLQVAVQSKENLSATSSQISLEGSAALNVSGSAANPVITGRTDLTSGELFYRNVRYQLQRGIITLADPNETRPNLDVSVSTTIEQ